MNNVKKKTVLFLFISLACIIVSLCSCNPLSLSCRPSYGEFDESNFYLQDGDSSGNQFFLDSLEDDAALTKSQKKTRAKLIKIIHSYLGVKYCYGGTTMKGMDCSGFVWKVFSQLGYRKFTRTSSKDLYSHSKRVRIKHAQAGDLIFFSRKGQVFHVGIYIGNKRFAHASREKGVIISMLSDKYYSRYFYGVGRICTFSKK